MLTAIIALTILAAIAGLMLGYANIKFHVEGDPIVERIDSLLPQTQCGQCGYPGCRPYAEAIANHNEITNKCVPGGTITAIAISELLGKKALQPVIAKSLPSKAIIDEQNCIGCTLCIQSCPVDAIIGAPKQLHQVIASECTGCSLCIQPCPVECIHMIPIPVTITNWQWPFPEVNSMYHLTTI
jgi:electron transport complex protein RnfB